MNPNQVEIHDKTFKIFIPKAEIRTRIMEMGREITKEFKDKDPVFIPILNGSFMFTADIVRACDFDCEMMFVKIRSYEGMESTGVFRKSIDLEGDIKGRHIIIVEDIIDTGNTVHQFMKDLEEREPASISVITFLLKPDAVKFNFPIAAVGYRIPNAFVVGYGLDYDELGRTLPDIYQLAE